MDLMQNHMGGPASVPASGRKWKRETAAQKLARAAQAAADVRAYDTNPDVVAYRIERMRTRVDRLIWTGLILGLLFTMANVQAFAAEGETEYGIAWWIAWLLDPMVSLVLVGVLLGEQVIARHQIVAGRWVRRTKWTALALTYAMNTWASWAALDPAQILLHSVPPLMVFCAAEAVTTLRHQITEAVRKAYRIAADELAADTAPLTTPVTPQVSADEGQRAVEELKSWMGNGHSIMLRPLTVAADSSSPRVTATIPPAVRGDATPDDAEPDTGLDTEAHTLPDTGSEEDREEDREESSDRDRPDEQDNKAAEAWIRAKCRGKRGVGRRPSWSQVAKQFGFSEGWAANRIRSVQTRMTDQGYEFRDDGTVLSPRNPLTVNGSEPVTASTSGGEDQ